LSLLLVLSIYPIRLVSEPRPTPNDFFFRDQNFA
jgi:hypothetical protein